MTRAGDADDSVLLARIIEQRDAHSFGILYERYTPMLYRLAVRLASGDTGTAEDIVHDAWVLAVPRMRDFKARSRLSSWLSGFVINLARERFRSNARDLDIPAEAAADDRVLAGTYDRIDIEQSLAALPHGYREVLVLHDVEGYTHDEIAMQLGISVGTTKSQLSRARAAMRRMLGEERARERERHV